ncbi:hypothetical protein D6T69_08860 [Tenacibaculum singaporense]|uniref:Uncharacterized protein n=1 Tax=Tenacibaculum singaporense TaxID=2358479 RepID=A0A3Q8RTC3_9FLAO|nr:hypothetical protein D6T69_08860 [Tenacibaculum singaporense]
MIFGIRLSIQFMYYVELVYIRIKYIVIQPKGGISASLLFFIFVAISLLKKLKKEVAAILFFFSKR